MVQQTRGRSNISPDVRRLPHKAARLLEHLRRRGASVVPTTSTPPWTPQQRESAIQRDPHQSFMAERDFVYAEMAEFCNQGYWLVLPYSAVQHLPNLRILPLGVVPQRNRRPRLIVDFTFSGVNQDTVPLAPREAMQFGRALQRVCRKIVRANPRYGPVHMAKIDIADGFYRVWVQHTDIPKLGVALPVSSGEQWVAFPLALPMGWVESPLHFTSLTETACDLANQTLREPLSSPAAHRLERVAATAPPSDALPPPPTLSAVRLLSDRDRTPTAYTDVSVDNFLLLAQTQHKQQQVLRAALHSIDAVFQPLAPDDPPTRQELASSVKKFLKGDASWSTFKWVLGWDINSQTMTIHLPPHRADRLREVLQWLRPPPQAAFSHQVASNARRASVHVVGAAGNARLLFYATTRPQPQRLAPRTPHAVNIRRGC